MIPSIYILFVSLSTVTIIGVSHLDLEIMTYSYYCHLLFSEKFSSTERVEVLNLNRMILNMMISKRRLIAYYLFYDYMQSEMFRQNRLPGRC